MSTEVKNVQFLYDDGSEATSVDEETYEQFGLPRGDIADELAYMLPSSTVQILQVASRPASRCPCRSSRRSPRPSRA